MFIKLSPAKLHQSLLRFLVLSVKEGRKLVLTLIYISWIGVCLTCPSKILSGSGVQDVDPASTLDDSVIEQGFALNCCLYPRSDMTIDIIDEDALVDAQFVKGQKTTY